MDYLRNIENLLSENKQSLGTYDLRAMSNNEQLFAISKYQRRALEKGGTIYQLVFWNFQTLHTWFIDIRGV